MEEEPKKLPAVLWLWFGMTLICISAVIAEAGGLKSTNPWIWVTFPFVALCLVVGSYGIHRFFHWGESTGNTSHTYIPRESKSWSALYNHLKDKDRKR